MNIVEINGEIGFDTTAGEFKNQLKGMSGDITVEISSPGGSVFHGIQMYNALANHKGHVTTINTGVAASMASYLMMVGDTVKAYDNSVLMVHNAIGMAIGNHHDLRSVADKIENLSALLANKYIDKTGKSKDEVAKLMDDETFFYGDEMFTAGFVDEIISTDKNQNKESALLSFKDEIIACDASSKEHCKIDGYGGDLSVALESISGSYADRSKADKIAKNSNTKVESMPKAETQELDAVQVELDTAMATILEKDDAIASLQTEFDGLKASLTDKDAEIVALGEKAEAKATLAKEIVAMGYEHDVSKETAMKMLDKDSIEGAGLVALESKTSHGSTETNDLDDEADAKAKAEKDELDFAMSVAKKYSVKG